MKKVDIEDKLYSLLLKDSKKRGLTIEELLSIHLKREYKIKY